MSTVKISAAHIPYEAQVLSAIGSANEMLTFSVTSSIRDLTAAHRHTHIGMSSGSTITKFLVELGSDYTQTTSKADHLILARADILKAQGVTAVTLSRSTDAASYTDEVSDSSFSSATLTGPDSQDYISTFTETSQYRYWRLQLTAGSSITPRFSKWYAGVFIDFGADPSSFETELVQPADAEWKSSAGVKFSTRTQDPYYRIRLEWDGVTDDELQDFIDMVYSKRGEAPVFLYAPVQTQILGGNTLLHCKCTAAFWEKKDGIDDYNYVSAEFEEMKG